MGEELQKTIETVLNGTTSKTGIAIKLLAQMVDNKFSEKDKSDKLRHTQLLNAINQNKEATEIRFKGLEVVSFFATHKTAFWVVVGAVLLLVGSGLENIITTIIKL